MATNMATNSNNSSSGYWVGSDSSQDSHDQARYETWHYDEASSEDSSSSRYTYVNSDHLSLHLGIFETNNSTSKQISCSTSAVKSTQGHSHVGIRANGMAAFSPTPNYKHGACYKY